MLTLIEREGLSVVGIRKRGETEKLKVGTKIPKGVLNLNPKQLKECQKNQMEAKKGSLNLKGKNKLAMLRKTEGISEKEKEDEIKPTTNNRRMDRLEVFSILKEKGQ